MNSAIVECDNISLLNPANRWRWIFALKCRLQLEILLLLFLLIVNIGYWILHVQWRH